MSSKQRVVTSGILDKLCVQAPSTTEVQMQTTSVGEPRSQNAAIDYIQIDISVYMQARVTGAVEACRLLYGCGLDHITLRVEAWKIHLERERKVLLRAEAMSTRAPDSLFIRCFKRPGLYTEIRFLDYFEQVRQYRTFTAYFQFQHSTIPQEYSIFFDFAVPRQSRSAIDVHEDEDKDEWCSERFRLLCLGTQSCLMSG